MPIDLKWVREWQQQRGLLYMGLADRVIQLDEDCRQVLQTLNQTKKRMPEHK
jgi:hypothetical protein